MGGYGALLLAETFPGVLRSVAAFSPAVSPADVVFRGASRLAGTPVGLWCGRSDGLCPDVRALHRSLPTAPAISGYGPGDHNFDYWSTVIPPAFGFIAETLTPGATPRSPGETHVLLRGFFRSARLD